MFKDIVRAAALLALVIGFVWVFGAKISEDAAPTSEVLPPPHITVVGTWECVPLKNGERSDPCVFGVARDQSDAHFVVDTQRMSTNVDVQVGERVRVEGMYTPAIALSSDHWQKYSIDGIISATVVQKI